MTPRLKNILLFSGIALVIILLYLFFGRGNGEEEALITTSGPDPLGVGAPLLTTSGESSPISQEFVSILLNIQNIKLDDSIFANPAFISLRDSSIILTPDGNEGRPNPFAPIGVDGIISNPLPTAP